jgi:polysaccharide biosynthesis protein PslH
MRVCVLALDDPWHHQHGGTARTRLLIEALTQAGHDTSVAYVADSLTDAPRLPGVTLKSVSTTPLGERSWAKHVGKYKRHFLPLPTIRGGMIAQLGHIVAEMTPDVLVVSQLRAAPYADFVPTAALWLDQADVWSLFLNQEVATRKGLARATSAMQLRRIQRAEVAWTHRAAAISTAGYGDREYLTSVAQKPVEWLPNAVARIDIPRVDDGTRTAGFIANFGFWPNQDAFNVLRDHWAPALRSIGWKTVVAGIGSEHLDGRGEVEILGKVDRLTDYYSRVDVALAPIRLGGGVKVKIIEALMYRRPVLATAYALEGFPPDLRSSIPTVSDVAPDFEPLSDGALTSEAAFVLADRYFSIEAWNGTISDLLETATVGRAE